MSSEMLLFKIKPDRIRAFGSMYKAGNGHWIVDLVRASKCLYAVFVVKGKNIIEEIYKIKEWCESTECPGKKVFTGERALDMEKKYAGKLISKNLRKRGRIGGRLYTREDELLD